MFLGPEAIIKKKQTFLWPPNFIQFYKNPPEIVKGEMQWLYDHTGKRYLDCFAGVSVMNCGHCNPDIVEATYKQMLMLQHTSIIYLTAPIVQLAEALSAVMPKNITRSFFTCTGSEANETALQMAKLYSGKTHFIAMEGGLHGRTYQTMSVTGIPMWRSDVALLDTVHFVKRYDHEDALADVKAVIDRVGADKIAAMIVEPIQGNGGIVTARSGYFKALHTLLKAHDILLIVDEVQTGFARTGKMFAFEHEDIEPDIVTVAKALGNGMPISAACTSDAIAAQFNRPSASTLGANPVCAQTALAVLKYIDNHDLVARSKKLGAQLEGGLLKLQHNYPDQIVCVRGKGLMLGMVLCASEPYSAAEATDFILEYALEQGVIIGKNGLDRNVLAFQPPLVIDSENIEMLLAVLEQAFRVLSRR